MAKRNSKKTESRSIITTIVAVLLLIVAVVASQITGIDFVGMLAGTPAPVVRTDAPPPVIGTPIPTTPGAVTTLSVPGGFGAQKGFWQVYFTQPSGSSNRATYTAGIDTQLAAAIAAVTSTLDIAAYEFNNPILTQAVLDAHRRGVRVRVVTDDEAGLHDEDATTSQLVSAGIPVVDDSRSALMHNKFMILDSAVVWTGSWNYTINDTYRNNNNALALRSRRAVQNYQAEFDEMFSARQFGPRSPANTPSVSFSQDGTPIEVYFAPEDNVVQPMINAINMAQRNIRFMAFSFTLSDVGTAVAVRASAGVQVQGIFETTGSETRFSQLTPLFCRGLQVRQDGGPFILHHKVFIIDDHTVVTGSFNFSSSATDSNDENLLIMRDPDLAALFIAEFERRWREGRVPANLTCS